MVVLIKNKSIESRVVIHKSTDRIVLMQATQFKTKSNIRFKTIECNEKTSNIEFNKMISKYQNKGYSLIEGIIPMSYSKHRAVDLQHLSDTHYVQAVYPGIRCVIKKSGDSPVVYSESGSVLNVPTISIRASKIFKELNIESVEAIITMFKPNSRTRFGSYAYNNQHILKNERDADLVIYDVCIPNLTFDKRRNMLLFIKGMEDGPPVYADAGIEVENGYYMMNTYNHLVSQGFTDSYVISADNKYKFASMSNDKYMATASTDNVIASVYNFDIDESGNGILYIQHEGNQLKSVIPKHNVKSLFGDDGMISSYVEVKIKEDGFKVINSNYEEL